MLLLSFMMQGL
uniref:Uncharacterized protein n=1 Tax=Moniliophthora roreri TaxID=221103 RepID=A0A0W0FNC4_MONRR